MNTDEHRCVSLRICVHLWFWVLFFGFGSGWPMVSTAQSLRWEQRPGYREAALSVPENGHTGFTLLRVEQTGVRFTNVMSYARSEANQNIMNGCGVAAGDFDGDGLCDLYFAATEGGNGLYRNLGNWRFADATVAAGVACSNQSSKGVVFADLNGDGRLDLVVGALGGPNACLLNLGDGRYTNVTAAAGLLSKAGAHSVALADIDGDGDLDLYIANYGDLSILRSGGQFSIRTINGKPTVTGRWAKRLRFIPGRLIELGEPDALLLNDGQAHFSPVSWTGGTFLNEDGTPWKTEPMDMGLSAMFRDINGDGAPDLYVCNDFQTPDRIWLNDGHGHFRAMADGAIRSVSHYSMGVDFADIDRDGRDDFFVGDMLSSRHYLRMRQMQATNPPIEEVAEVWDRHQVRRNTLNMNRGDGSYVEVANFAGVDASDWTWAVAFLDVDLDGYEDLLAVNGHAYDTQDMDMYERMPSAEGNGSSRLIGRRLKDFPPLITPNVAFHNRGDRTFTEMGSTWGFDSTNVSHGLAMADFDNDGDLDLAVNCLWQPPLLYRNESKAPRVAVRLKGIAPNTKGIGARIRLSGGVVPFQSQEIQAGGRYLSGDEPMRTFAAGDSGEAMTLEVAWRSGRVSTIRGIRANRIYEVDETGAAPAPSQKIPPPPTPLFRDVTATLGHHHAEPAMDEAERQPLLYRGLTRLGPGVAWLDFDGDGRDELIVGGEYGTNLAVFKIEADGKWKPWPTQGAATLSNDVAGLAAWVSAKGERCLLLAPSTYRPGQESARSLLAASIPGATGRSALDEVAKVSLDGSSPGPIAVADYDGDGDLDVFVGGRVIPGRYAEPANSLLLRNDSGRLAIDTVTVTSLQRIGLVSGAVWSDLDGDGWPELVLACEWGPIRVFRNVAGRLQDATTELGLAGHTGWWAGVATGDLDGDGRLDIIASNWGWNSCYHRPSEKDPVRMFHGDIDDNGTWDILETEAEGGRIWPRRNLLALTHSMPWLRLKFPTHRAYSEADMTALLDEKRSRARQVEATTFTSTIFFNRGNRFESIALPDEAQYSPAYAVNVADLDGDGFEDIFLSQNCFGVRTDEHRLAAGRGLWLRGVGQGRLSPVSSAQAGILIDGEQRGAALGDYDGDGRVDLVVAQVAGLTRLFHNETGRSGLRVRLAGSTGNPDGVGAVVRLKFRGSNGDEQAGSAREIKAGSGYWSQDSLVAVLATPLVPSAIEVRWPGGKLTTSAVPPGAKEIRVESNGSLRPIR